MDTQPTASSTGASSQGAAPPGEAAISADFLQMLAVCLQTAAAGAGAAPTENASCGQTDVSDGSGGRAEEPAPDPGIALVLAGLAVPVPAVMIDGALAEAAPAPAGELSRLLPAVIEARKGTEPQGGEPSVTTPAAAPPVSAHQSGLAAPLGASPEADLPARAAARAVHVPVGSAGWPGELGEEVLLLAGEGNHSAALRLSPEHLGPLEVRIAVRDGETTVYFGAAHAETRAALEQAMPRLRELLASQGLVLADAGVFGDASRDAPRAAQAAPGRGSAVQGDSEEPITARVRRATGLVDVFA